MPAKSLAVSFGIFEYHVITFLSQNYVVLLSFSLFLHFLDRLLSLIFFCRTKSYQLYCLKQLTCLAFLVPCKVYANLELLNKQWHSLSPLCCITHPAGAKNDPILFPLFRKGAIGTKPEILHLYMKTHPVCFSLQTWPECRSLLNWPHFFI